MAEKSLTQFQPAAKPDDDPVAIGLRLGNAIAHMVRNPLQVAYCNRTFGEFIKACRDIGIHDDDPLSMIEYGCSQLGSGFICKERDEDDGIEIREVSRSEMK